MRDGRGKLNRWTERERHGKRERDGKDTRQMHTKKTIAEGQSLTAGKT